MLRSGSEERGMAGGTRTLMQDRRGGFLKINGRGWGPGQGPADAQRVFCRARTSGKCVLRLHSFAEAVRPGPTRHWPQVLCSLLWSKTQGGSGGRRPPEEARHGGRAGRLDVGPLAIRARRAEHVVFRSAVFADAFRFRARTCTLCVPCRLCRSRRAQCNKPGRSAPATAGFFPPSMFAGASGGGGGRECRLWKSVRINPSTLPSEERCAGLLFSRKRRGETRRVPS